MFQARILPSLIIAKPHTDYGNVFAWDRAYYWACQDWEGAGYRGVQ